MRIQVGGQDIELAPGTRLRFEGVITILPPHTAESKEEAHELARSFIPVVNVQSEQHNAEMAEQRRIRLRQSWRKSCSAKLASDGLHPSEPVAD